MRIENLQNENRKYVKSIGNFHVLEYVHDASVSPMNAMNEYFMSKMNVRRRQVVIDIDKDHSAILPYQTDQIQTETARKRHEPVHPIQ